MGFSQWQNSNGYLSIRSNPCKMKGTHTVSDQVVEAVPVCDVSSRGVGTNEMFLVLRSGSRIKSSGEESEMMLSFASIQLRTVVPLRTQNIIRYP